MQIVTIRVDIETANALVKRESAGKERATVSGSQSVRTCEKGKERMWSKRRVAAALEGGSTRASVSLLSALLTSLARRPSLMFVLTSTRQSQQS